MTYSFRTITLLSIKILSLQNNATISRRVSSNCRKKCKRSSNNFSSKAKGYNHKFKDSKIKTVRYIFKEVKRPRPGLLNRIIRMHN
jgi:hypothetical protein